MKFVGFEGFKTLCPNVEVVKQERVFDLHNEGVFESFVFDKRRGVVELFWIFSGENPGYCGQPGLARVCIRVLGVQKLAVKGEDVFGENEPLELDFVEYVKLSGSLCGLLSFQFLNGLHIDVEGRRCEVNIIAGAEEIEVTP